MATNRTRTPRRRRSSGLSEAEDLYISGAPYDTPLPPSINKWEWWSLHYGPGGKLTKERKDYLDGLRAERAATS